MSEVAVIRKRARNGGRQKGTPNRFTSDIRSALRDLAEGNSDRVQGWLDRVAETDPAEALRLWLSLLRFVTPTLQAAAFAEFSKPKSLQMQLNALTDAELMAAILGDPNVTAAMESKARPLLSLDSGSLPATTLKAVNDELLQ